MAEKMFCYQCEQTAKGQGCNISGVCGKTPDVAALQDLLIYALRGLSLYAVEAGKKGIEIEGLGPFTAEALFATLTNVNFDAARFPSLIKKAVEYREELKSKTGVACIEDAATFKPAGDINGLVAQAAVAGLKADASANPDLLSLQHIVLFGLKGLAAYADHARILGQEDQSVYTFIYEALAAPFNKKLGADEWVGLALKTGEVNLRVMELLDAGNTGAFGHPVPTSVPLGQKKGKAILVSGHDLKDLGTLLKQTEGTGINVYTHGEMLPCHGYPELKKYSHLYGHYGTAWQNQAKEFAAFPGAILMTTNCIQKPTEAYKDNIFYNRSCWFPGRHACCQW